MGVGINYKGVGGNRHFDLNGVPTGEADALFKTPRRHKQLLPENFKKALHPQPIDPIATEKEGKVKLNAFDMRPDTLDKKTMPGSAVTTSMSGLCLEGEQQNPSIIGTKLYGSHGGKKGYHSIEEIDPSVPGERVGVLGAGGAGADNSVAKSGAPFSYQVASRVVMEMDNRGRTILVEYDKDVQNSALGRTHTVTGERRRVVGTIDPSTGEFDFLHPFKVKYDEKFQEWIIYLPEKSVMDYSDTNSFKELPLKESMKDASNGEADWYVIENVSDGGVFAKVILKEGAEEAGENKIVRAGFEITQEKGGALIAIVTIPTEDVSASVDQRIFSPIIISSGEGSEGFPVNLPDDRSLSNKEMNDGGAQPTAYWSIMGFGRFTLEDNRVMGQFAPASTNKIELPVIIDNTGSNINAETPAFLVRTGNIDEPDANFLGYRYITFTPCPAPFSLEKDGSGLKIKNNVFFLDGKEYKAKDYDMPPEGGIIYLVGEKGQDGVWRFRISNVRSESEHATQIINLPLYSIAGGKVECDYRTSFLTLSSYSGSAAETPFEVVITKGASSSTARLKNCIFYFRGKEVRISDPPALTGGGSFYLVGEPSSLADGKNFDFFVSTQSSSNSAAINIKLYDISDGEVKMDYRTTFLTLGGGDVEIEEGEDNVHLVIKKTAKGYELAVPELSLNINGGKGIKVQSAGRGATIINTGVTSVMGEASGSFKLNGDLLFRGAEGSGLTFTTVKSEEIDEEQDIHHTNGRVIVDLVDRPEGETWGIREMTVEGGEDKEPKTVKFFGTEDVAIKQNNPEEVFTGDVPLMTGIEISSKGGAAITRKKLIIKDGLITSVEDMESESLAGSELNVVTGVEFTNDTLTANMSKVSVLGAAEASPNTILSMREVNVVSDVKYENPIFSKTTTKVKAVMSEGSSEESATVFETTPLSEE